MKRQYYYPKTWGALLPFLQNLSAKAPHYVAQLNVTPAELEFLTRMSAACAALVNFQHQAKNFAEDWTRLRDQCFDGATTAPPPAWPAWNGPATPPVALESGCNIKLRALLHRWKTAAGYNDAIGENLGLVGPVIAVDAVGAQPELRVKLVAGRPEISASLEHFDAVELEVDRGEGFALLDVSTGPPVRDAHPLPAAGTSAVWTYRGILRAKNTRVGQWSPVVVVPVLGI